MKRIIIDSMADVAKLMYENVNKHHEDVQFVGFYEDAVDVISELVSYDDVYLYQVHIEPEEWDGYDKEYLVSLDENLCIWCEKAYRYKSEGYEKDEYLYSEAYCTLIADDCNSALLSHIKSEVLLEVSYGIEDENECDCDCEHCLCNNESGKHEEMTRVAVDEKGNTRGFEKSWTTHEDGMYYHSTYKYYSNNPDMLKQMMDNFDIKH